MNDSINFSEEEKPTLSSGLNVLTILTFIGSGIALISAFWTYFTVEKSYDTILKAQENMANAPAFVKSLMGPEMVENAKKSVDNKLPILILTVVGAALCIYGALEMRKLKKQGFVLWLAGELLPIAGIAIFLGFALFQGFAALFMLIPIAFIILYAVQRKNLVY
jgi:uncharacterized membrane protein